MIKQLKITYDLDIPMRDGVLLRANVFGPDDDLAYPAILLRFPYLKDSFPYHWGRLNPLPLAEAGYRVVIQDCRGTGKSQGGVDFDGPAQSDDGYDTVEWIAAQPWCDGSVGMYGLSYYGFTQLLTAQAQPPHLKAICPWQQTGLYKYSGGFTTGSLHLMWLLERARDHLGSPECGIAVEERACLSQQVAYYLNHFSEVVEHLPEAENPAARIEGLPFLADYARRMREYDDPACPAREGRPIDFSKIRIPCFFLGGWYDETSKNGPLENWIALSSLPDGAQRVQSCKLLMGPWNHGEAMPVAVGCRSFGVGSAYPMEKSITEHLIRWFDHHLKGLDNGVDREPPVLVYEMGRNRWRHFDSWPVTQAVERKLYLSSDGAAVTSLESGSLSEALSGDGGDAYEYDPRNPVPSRVPGISSECQDQAPLESRGDVLVYTSAVLEQELEVIGSVRAELFIGSSCPDTDFMCKLTEVYPDGHSINITDGAVRASYNNTYRRVLLRPDEVRSVTVHLGNTCNVFQKGSRIRLTITSSSFPKYDRNHNTDARIGATAETARAQNSVFHGSTYPSHLVLPILY